MDLKELILLRLTRSAFFLRDIDLKDVFPLLLHKNLNKIDLCNLQVDDSLLEFFEICTEMKDVRLSGSIRYYPSSEGKVNCY